MTSRPDTPSFRLGAYAAKQCVVRTQNDVLKPGEPATPPLATQYIFDDGNAFEALVVEDLRKVAEDDWCFVDRTADAATREQQTLTAIDRRATVIVDARLPVDFKGHRAGEPDLLVFADDGYVPIDIKHHRTVRPENFDDTYTISALSNPTPAGATSATGALRKSRTDALQLAHYRAMLATLNISATAAIGGIIGKERIVAWYDLATPMWRTPAKSDGRKVKDRTTLEIYDFEFNFRVDIARTAVAHVADPSVPLLVEPIRSNECSSCPWRNHCDPIIEAGSGDPSLLPRVYYKPWRALRDAGITDRSGVAALDRHTALVAAEISIQDWLDAATDHDAAASLANVKPRAKKALAALEALQVTSVGHLRTLDPATIAVGGGGWLAEAVLAAKVVEAPDAVYLRPGIHTLDVPRADIEIDIDMENTLDGVYMWGTFVTDRTQSGVSFDGGYRPFVTWAPMGETSERAVFDSFWSWFTTLVDEVEGAGLTVKAYVWYEQAENSRLLGITAADPEVHEAVVAMIDSDRWIDLREVYRNQLSNGGSTSLKAIAPLAGFSWGVDEPGGAYSMVKHREALSEAPDIAAKARTWLLTYNEGDVAATKAIREWMDGSTFEPIPGLTSPDAG